MSETPLPPIEPEPDVIAIVEAALEHKPPPEDAAARYFAQEAVSMRDAVTALRREQDWPNLSRYRAANAALQRPPDMVMIGDSITEIWQVAMPEIFRENVVNRGISGQTSPQILLRFMADVVDLKPARVHLMCGTNDIAGNTGPNPPSDFQRNVRAMISLAQAHEIEVVIGAIPPASEIFWQQDSDPKSWIPYLNDWLRNMAAKSGAEFVDYATVLGDGQGGLQPQFSADGVHVTKAAYGAMWSLLECMLPPSKNMLPECAHRPMGTTEDKG